MKKRFFIIGFITLGIFKISFSQDSFEKYLCPNETYTEITVDTEIPKSDGYCRAATRLFISKSDNDDIIKSYDVERIGKTPGPFTSKIKINWNGNKEGVVVIKVEYERRLYKGFPSAKCEWKGRNPAYTYRITRKNRNPGGSLIGNSEYILKDESNIDISLNYDGSTGDSRNVNKIRYSLNGGGSIVVERADESDDYISFKYSTDQTGTYSFTTEVFNECGKWMPGPFKMVQVFPSCHNDDPTSARISLSGNELTHHPEGIEITKDVQYAINVSGVTDFYSHYEITHDGGEDLDIFNGNLIANSGLGSYRIDALKKQGRETCPDLDPLSIFLGGRNTTIEDNCLITLPTDLFKDDVVIIDEPFLKYFSATVSSKRGIIVKPGITLSLGSELILDYEEPQVPEDEFDLDKNFIQSTSYDEYNRIISQSRQYFDNQGRATQAQYKHITNNTLMASEVLYDAKGRPVVNTLSAPVAVASITDQSDGCGQDVQQADLVAFDFKEGFVVDGEGNPYDHKNFDLDKEQNPDPVGTDEGTLGWYYSDNNGTSIHNQLNEPLVATTQFPYSRTLYHHDGSGEVKSATKPGDAFRAGGGHLGSTNNLSVTNDDPYLLDYLSIRTGELNLSSPEKLTENFFKTESIDAAGKKSISYIDQGGKSIISLYYGSQPTPITRSYQFYNDKGQLIVSLSPNGWEHYNGSNFNEIDKTSYIYDARGRMIATEEADAGRTEYLYRNDGKIRFSQNAKQREENKFSYTNYDRSGRPVESGEYEPGASGIGFSSVENILENEDSDGGLSDATGTKYDRVVTVYDLPDPSIPNGREQRFLIGAVSYTWNNESTTWYSYDELGRVEWMVQHLTGLGIKTIDYRYDPQGNVMEVAFQKGNAKEDFYHYYEYDLDGRLTTVYTATEPLDYDLFGKLTNKEVLTKQAAYKYYLHGLLKRVELANNLQGIDYLYTADGALKSINHADKNNDPGEDGQDNGFREDVFGMTLDYYNNDYSGAGYNTGNLMISGEHPEQYTGNIRAASWHSPIDGNKSRTYVYDYDDRYQLSRATWGDHHIMVDGSYGFVNNSKQAYTVNIPNFDLNGNIRKLQRKGELGKNIADFTYNYRNHTNRLLSVQNGTGEYANYKYNEIGQMTRQEKGGEIWYTQYDVSGKVSGVFKDYDESTDIYSEPLVMFAYDDRGFRLSKTSYDDEGNEKLKTWYVRDAVGNVVSTYTQEPEANAKQYEVPIYGSGRLGMYRPNELLSNYMYELNDHLGNVRAVIGEKITIESLATMESERDVSGEEYYESMEFNIYNRIPTADFINHTPSTIVVNDIAETIENPNEVIRLNNAINGTSSGMGDVISGESNTMAGIGATFTDRVYPGDKITMSVMAKYVDFEKSEENLYPTMISYLTSAFGTPVILDRPAEIFNFMGEASFAAHEAWQTVKEDQPKAYLNYIVFDDKFQYQKFGVKQIGLDAKVPDNASALNHPFEKLELEVEIEKEGYIYVYLSNEDQQNMEIYFDDFYVKHEYNDVVAGGDFYPFGSVMANREITRDDYRYGYQGQFAEHDEETGWSSFEARMYDPVIGRWSTTDPYFQFHSPYMAMGNNPVMYVDSDGRWVHIAAGALIGGGIAAYSLYRKGELEWSWRAAGKIALGAGTGAAIAAVPGAALSSVGQLGTGTIAGVSTRLIGNSIIAGTIAGTGSLLDQSLDVHTGHKAAVSLSDAAVNAGVTAATFGIGGHYYAQARYAARHARWSGTNSQFAKFVDNLPNVSAAALNSFIDLSRAGIENNWWNFNFNFGGDNLVRGETPWGFQYAVPKGQTVVLPEIVITPDPE